jgi:hypothetical protein
MFYNQLVKSCQEKRLIHNKSKMLPLPFVPSCQGEGKSDFLRSRQKKKRLKKYTVDFRLTIDKF